jgi:Asp/Glu/hydantoin racemase
MPIGIMDLLEGYVHAHGLRGCRCQFPRARQCGHVVLREAGAACYDPFGAHLHLNSPRGSMWRIVLVNPNTSEALTTLMVEIAREVAPACFRIDGLTARFGAPLLTNEAELDEAVRAVRALAQEVAQSADAIIVCAFGDPGADELATLLNRPVIGIAEASMRAAAANGRRFAVVTHTGRLARRMALRAQDIGLGAHCVCVLATAGDPVALMAKPGKLERALKALAEQAIRQHGAEAIVIGGGPLGRVAKALSGKVGVPVIEAIPEAVRYLATALGAAATR